MKSKRINPKKSPYDYETLEEVKAVIHEKGLDEPTDDPTLMTERFKAQLELYSKCREWWKYVDVRKVTDIKEKQ